MQGVQQLDEAIEAAVGALPAVQKLAQVAQQVLSHGEDVRRVLRANPPCAWQPWQAERRSVGLAERRVQVLKFCVSELKPSLCTRVLAKMALQADKVNRVRARFALGVALLGARHVDRAEFGARRRRRGARSDHAATFYFFLFYFPA